MINHFSYSQLNRWNTCHYQYHLAYEQGLMPREDTEAQSLGLTFHNIIATAARKHFDEKPSNEGLIQFCLEQAEHFAQNEEQLEVVRGIIPRTLREINFSENWEILTIDGQPIIEYEISYPMFADVAFLGRADLVARNKQDGLTYVIDWKTRRNAQPNEDRSLVNEEFNDQLIAYAYVLSRGYNIPVHGYIVYQINSNFTKPELLSSGQMSKKYIATDWDNYKRALLDAGLNPDDYQDMQSRLSQAKWTNPVVVYLSDHKLNLHWANILNTYLQIVQLPMRVKNFGAQCKFCSYSIICLGEDKEWDIDDIINKEFTFKEGFGGDDANNTD